MELTEQLLSEWAQDFKEAAAYMPTKLQANILMTRSQQCEKLREQQSAKRNPISFSSSGELRSFLFKGWGGCSDHGCVVKGPRKGMGTNGGCRCLVDASRSSLNILQSRVQLLIHSLDSKDGLKPAQIDSGDEIARLFRVVLDRWLASAVQSGEVDDSDAAIFSQAERAIQILSQRAVV